MGESIEADVEPVRRETDFRRRHADGRLSHSHEAGRTRQHRQRRCGMKMSGRHVGHVEDLASHAKGIGEIGTPTYSSQIDSDERLRQRMGAILWQK